MITKNGKSLTARGIKPICTFQQKFQSLYLFGAFSPLDGKRLLLEMPCCNSDSFQAFLDEFSKMEPLEFKILVLDNGSFHKAKCLQIPLNVALVFLPPYSPELNPAEKIWAKFKRQFTNRLFKTLEEIEEFMTEQCLNLSQNQVMSICRYKYIFLGQLWTTI